MRAPLSEHQLLYVASGRPGLYQVPESVADGKGASCHVLVVALVFLETPGSSSSSVAPLSGPV